MKNRDKWRVASFAGGNPQAGSLGFEGVARPAEIGGTGAAKAAQGGPPCRITSAEWEAREPVRQLLENILTRHVERCEAQRQATLKESLAGPSPYERAAEIALAHPHVALMQRMEESNFRQIWRITTLLLKIKNQARGEQSREMPARSRDVYERKAS